MSKLFIRLVFEILVIAKLILAQLEESFPNPFKNEEKKTFNFHRVKWQNGDLMTFEKEKSIPLSYQDLPVVSIDENYNQSINLASKLSHKLLHYFTNGYQPGDVLHSHVRNPFKNASTLKSPVSLSLYESLKRTMSFELRDEVEQVEIIDVLSSSSQISVAFCGKETLIRQSPCDAKDHLYTQARKKGQINFSIVGSKIGNYSFRLYLLVSVDGRYRTVVAQQGSFVVNPPSQNLNLRFKNQYFIVQKGSVFDNVIYLKNKSKQRMHVHDPNIDSVSGRLKMESAETLALTSGTKPIPETRFYSDVFPNEEKPIFVISIFSPIDPEKDKSEILSSFSNFTKSTINSNLKFKNVFPEKNGRSHSLLSRNSSLEFSVDWTASEGENSHPKDRSPISPEFENSSLKVPSPILPELENVRLNFKVDSKSLQTNILVYHRDKKFIWENEHLNLGVLCDTFTRHSTVVFVSNYFRKNIILNGFFFNNFNHDFSLEFELLYNHPIIFPMVQERFPLLKVIVGFSGQADFAVLRGELVAQINVDGQDLSERLPVVCHFQRGLFEIVAGKDGFLLSDLSQELSVVVKLNWNAEIEISKIDFAAGQNNNGFYAYEKLWENGSPKDKFQISPNKPVEIFKVKFTEPPNSNIFQTANSFSFTFHAMETPFSVSALFYYDYRLCSSDKEGRVFKKCSLITKYKMTNSIEDNFAKSAKLYVKNNQPVSMFLRAVNLPEESVYYQAKLILFVAKKEGIRLLKEITVFSREDPRTIWLNATIQPEEELVLEVEIDFNTGRIRELKDYREFFAMFGLQFSDKHQVFFNTSFIYSRKLMVNVFPRSLSVKLDNVYQSVVSHVEVVTNNIGQINEISVLLHGTGSNLVKILSVNKMFFDGQNRVKVELSIDPFNVISPRPDSAKFKDKPENFTMNNLEGLFREKLVWETLNQTREQTIDTKMEIRSPLIGSIFVPIRGHLLKQAFHKPKLVLNYCRDCLLNQSDLKIENNFKRSYRVTLFLAPRAFVNREAAFNELKTKVRLFEKKEFNFFSCLESSLVSTETVKMIAQRMLKTDFRFLFENKGNNSVCFEPLSPNKQLEHKRNFDSLKMYFKLSSYDVSEVLPTHFEKKIVVLRDIEDYSKNAPLNSLSFPSNKDRTLDLGGFIRRLFGVFSASQQATKRTTFKRKGDELNVTSLIVQRNFSEYLSSKSVFLDRGVANRTIFLRRGESFTLKNAISVLLNRNKWTNFDELSLFVKTDKSMISEIPVEIKETPVSLVPVDFKAQETKIRNFEHSIYVSVSSRELIESSANLKLPFVKTLIFENQEDQPLRIISVRFENGRLREDCFQISKIRPMKLRRHQRLRVKFAIHFCRKMSSFLKSRLVVTTSSKKFTFEVVVNFEDFYVALSRKNQFKFILFYGQSCVFAFALIWFSLWFVQRKGKLPTNQPAVKCSNGVFIPRKDLNEKLLVHQVTVETWLKLASERNEKEQILEDIRQTEEETEENRLRSKFGKRKKKKTKKQIDFTRQSLGIENQAKIPVLESSNVSVEQICKIFENEPEVSEKSSEEQTLLIQKGEVIQDLNLEENKYGAIGDKNVNKNKPENLSFNNLNDIVAHSQNSIYLRPKNDDNEDDVLVGMVEEHNLNKTKEDCRLLEEMKGSIQDQSQADRLDDDDLMLDQNYMGLQLRLGGEQLQGDSEQSESESSFESKLDLEKAFNIVPLKGLKKTRKASASEKRLKLNEIKQKIQTRNMILGNDLGMVNLLNDEASSVQQVEKEIGNLKD